MSYLNKDPCWERLQKEKKHGRKIYSRKELYDLNKGEQVDLIISIDKSVAIPRYEKDRVELILELQ